MASADARQLFSVLAWASIAAGGEARRPLGLAVVGGLVVSQVITLYLTPVIYTYMARWVETRRIPSIATAPNGVPGRAMVRP